MDLLKAKQNGFHGTAFIERICNFKCDVKRYVPLSEIDDSDSLVVNETTGYYVVNEEESVIFYSFSDATRGIFFSSLLPNCTNTLFRRYHN